MDDEEILRNWKEQPAIPYIAVKRMLIEARADEHLRKTWEWRGTLYVADDLIKKMGERIEAFERGNQAGRADEREQLSKPTAIGSCQVCGMDDAVIKAYEKGAKDEREANP